MTHSVPLNDQAVVRAHFVEAEIARGALLSGSVLLAHAHMRPRVGDVVAHAADSLAALAPRDGGSVARTLRRTGEHCGARADDALAIQTHSVQGHHLTDPLFARPPALADQLPSGEAATFAA